MTEDRRNRLTRSIVNTLVPAGIILICASVISYLQIGKLSKIENSKKFVFDAKKKQEFKDADSQQRSSLALLDKLPLFGFENLIADCTFLNFLQYFGDDKVRDLTGYALSPDFFKVMVDKDPRFIEVYPYLSSSVTMFAGQPHISVALLEKGLAVMDPKKQPEAYYLWRAKGTDELLFLEDAKVAIASFLKAAEWARQSSLPEAAASAEISEATAKFIAQNPVSRRAKVSAWLNILGSSIDDQTRKRAMLEIRALGGSMKQDSQGHWKVSYPSD